MPVYDNTAMGINAMTTSFKLMQTSTSISRAALLCLLALAGTSLSAQTVAVPSVAVRMVDRAESYTLDAVVQAVKQSTVSAQTSGRVTALLVKAGDKVRAGQVLATIDASEAQLGVQRAQAQMDQASAVLQNAKAQVERARALQQQGYISQAGLDTAESQYRAAAAVQAQALAGNKLAGVSATYTKVTAPFDGWVQQTLVQPGDLAAPGVPLLVVYSPQSLRAMVLVPASRNAFVRDAKQTTLVVEDAATAALVPTHRQEIPSADPVSQTTEWRLDIAPRDGAILKPGQQLRVTFAGAGVAAHAGAGAAAVLSVPASAVVKRGELSAVYVRTEKGFALRAVRLGNGVGADGVEVIAGLSADAVVALDPNLAVQAGATAQLVK